MQKEKKIPEEIETNANTVLIIHTKIPIGNINFPICVLLFFFSLVSNRKYNWNEIVYKMSLQIGMLSIGILRFGQLL